MRNSKKLLISLCLLLVAIFATTSTTFAWFALNSTADVEDFNMQITSGDDSLVLGIEEYSGTTMFSNLASISTAQYDALSSGVLKTSYTDANSDGTYEATPAQIDLTAFKALENPTRAIYRADTAGKQTQIVYYNTLTIDVLKNAIEFVDAGVTVDANDQLSTKMNQVTCNKVNKTFSTTNSNLDDYTTGLTTAVKNVDYTSFKLYFKSTSTGADKKVFLADTATVTAPVGAGKTVTAWSDITAKTGDNNGSFGNTSTTAISTGNAIDVYAANAVRVAFTAGDAESPMKIWDPNADKGFVTNGEGSLAEAWLETYTNKTINFGTSPANDNTDVLDSICALTTNGTFSTGSVEIDIWIEGTDGECFNVIFEDIFNTSLIFKCN